MHLHKKIIITQFCNCCRKFQRQIYACTCKFKTMPANKYKVKQLILQIFIKEYWPKINTATSLMANIATRNPVSVALLLVYSK